MAEQEAEAIEFLEAIIEAKEKLEKKVKVKKKEIPAIAPAPLAPTPTVTPVPELAPPIYKRPLPPLPPPPRVTPAWPLPPPRPPWRPVEREAAAPRIAEVPTPFPPLAAPTRQPTRPIIIKPSPVVPAQLNLGSLNSLIADESITTIQCDGANLPIKIIKERRLEEIALVLSEEEIKSIIRAFSEASGQPITEPIFKASVAGLTISAQISAFTGCRFVIARG